MKKFWRFQALTEGGDSAELVLYGTISDATWWGDEITPQQFKDDLDALGDIKSLTVRINSYGGDVFAAHAIHNILTAHPARVTVRIDGIAASAATLVMLAGEEIVMPQNAMIMVHNPWTIALGDARELRKAAEVLDKVRDSMLAAYQDRTGIERGELIGLLNSETWMTAQEAVEKGFADTVETNERVATALDNGRITIGGFAFDLSQFRTVPVALLIGASLPRETRGEINTGSAGEPEQTNDKEESTMGGDTPEVEQAAVTLAEPTPDPTETLEEIAARERGRILGIQKLAVPGAEAMIEAAIENGETPEQAALAIMTSDVVKNATALAARKRDAAAADGVEPGPVDPKEAEMSARVATMATAGNERQGTMHGGGIR